MDVSTIACLRLIKEMDCERHSNHPYCGPFIRYVMQWPHSLPIKTIIIGQNPYPGDIFPNLGAALAYDENKVRSVPPSIRVLAEDLFNYNETPKTDTINAFKDSWKMLDIGVLMINETVFHKISGVQLRPNTGGHRDGSSDKSNTVSLDGRIQNGTRICYIDRNGNRCLYDDFNLETMVPE